MEGETYMDGKIKAEIVNGESILGIEFGSTRIKGVPVSYTHLTAKISLFLYAMLRKNLNRGEYNGKTDSKKRAADRKCQ